jgi:hypothetical protein
VEGQKNRERLEKNAAKLRQENEALRRCDEREMEEKRREGRDSAEAETKIRRGAKEVGECREDVGERVGVRIPLPHVGAVGTVELDWNGNRAGRGFGCIGE